MTKNFEKPMSYKQLESIHTKLIKEIKTSLDSFENSLLENIPQAKILSLNDLEESKEVHPELSKTDVNIETLKVKKYFEIKAPVGWDSIEYLDDLALGNDSGNLEIWDIQDFKLISSHPLHKNYINCVKYSKTKKKIITASLDNKINTLQVLGTQIKPFKALSYHTDKVYAIIIIENQDLFITSGRDPDLKVWHLNNCSFKYKISTNGKNYAGTKMEFIPHLNIIAVSFKEGLICFYNLKTGTEVSNIKISSEWIHAMCFIEKRNELFLGTSVGTIMSWVFEGEKIKKSRTYNVPGDVPCTIIPSKTNHGLIISSKADTIFYLDLEKGDCTSSIPFEFKAWIIKEIPNLNMFLIAGRENKIAVVGCN